MRSSLTRHISGLIAAALFSATFAFAQQPASRILQEIDSSSAATLPAPSIRASPRASTLAGSIPPRRSMASPSTSSPRLTKSNNSMHSWRRSKLQARRITTHGSLQPNTPTSLVSVTATFPELKLGSSLKASTSSAYPIATPASCSPEPSPRSSLLSRPRCIATRRA